MGIRTALGAALGPVGAIIGFMGDKRQKEKKAERAAREVEARDAALEGEGNLTDTKAAEGETIADAEKRRRRALLSGVQTSSLGIPNGQEVVGKSTLLGG